MTHILFAIIISALAGYACARTIIQESLFGDLVQKFVLLTRHHDDYDKEIFVMDNKVMQRQEIKPGEFELVCISESDLRNPFKGGIGYVLFYPLSLAWAKLGDLIGCIWCLSGQLSLQFYFWTFGFWGFIPVTIPAMFAAVAITFMINDWANKHNKED